MKFNKNWKDEKWLQYSIATCSAVLLYFLLDHISIVGVWLSFLWQIISPLFVGLILAYLMDPIAKFFQAKGLKRQIAVIVTLVVIATVVGGLLLLLVPQLIKGVVQFVESFGSYVESFEMTLSNLSGQIQSGSIDISKLIDAIIKFLEKMAEAINPGNLLRSSVNVGSGVVTFLMGVILAIYFLFDKEKMITFFMLFLKKQLPEENFKHLIRFVRKCNEILLSYLSCSVLEAVLVAVVNALLMIIARMPYVTVISFVVGITNLAPTFGPLVGCVIGMFILLLVKPGFAITFLIFTLVLQTVDGYIIKPKLFGDTFGVSPLLILICIIVGGRIFGVWGILLAIPFAAICEYIFNEMIRSNRKNYR